MRHLSQLNEEIALWSDLESNVETLSGLIDLSVETGDLSLEGQIEEEISDLRSRLERLEFNLALNGKYDRDAALVAIHAGAGGTESQDWAETLMRMYLRWGDDKSRPTRVLDLSPGEEAGIKSVTMEIDGAWAYGYLKSERGVHRLVRLSPFDADHLRHTSFALVEILPQAEDDIDITIDPDDIKTDYFKSSGAGGQHVQKNLTAVRITHLPTGIVVTCQNERSQLQNREAAMKVLRARLLEIELDKKAEEQARLKGEHVDPGWGNQIRSYVLHPYKLVKDHRSGFESTNPEAVLEGDLDPLLEAYLKAMIGTAAPG
jgi:peptide chain release factor 2